MDFSFTKEQELLRSSVREFAEKVIAPRVDEMERTGEPPMDIVKEMAKLGMFGVCAPKEFGGTALGHIARMIMIEEISRVSAAVGMTLQTLHIGVGAIADGGNDAQRKEYLPSLAKGSKLAATAVTEATGGSDPGALQSTAKLAGDFYVVNGRKCFISDSHFTDIHLATARTGEGPRGVSAFIIEKGFPGFRPSRVEHKFGLRGCQTGEVVYENCQVPKKNILGAEGEGLRIMLRGISDYGRPGVTACSLGVLTACLEAASKFAKQRVLYGKPISELQAIQWLITDIFVDLETSRLLAYRAAWLKDTGARPDAEIAMAKLYVTEAAVRSAKKAVDIHGGYGCMMEYPVQRYYRDAQVLIAGAGTSEIQRLIMLRKALG